MKQSMNGKGINRFERKLFGQLKQARFASMSEAEFAAALKELEDSRLFLLLKKSGIIRMDSYSHARYAARQYAGYGLKLTANTGLYSLLDGNSSLVQLIRRIGSEKFEKWFLKGVVSDMNAAKECGLTAAQIKKIRVFVNKVYIQSEFEQVAPGAPVPSSKVYSAVAGIALEKGEPFLSFFHREIWKGQYAVNQQKLSEYLHSVPEKEASQAEATIINLEFLERRKTTLYALLEILLREQKKYFITGEPCHRRPLTQRALASDIGINASVLCRLISNKSVQLPWGLEVPIVSLIPSSKQIYKEILSDIIEANPEYTDEKLRTCLLKSYGVKLSRQSITQYRSESGI